MTIRKNTVVLLWLVLACAAPLAKATTLYEVGNSLTADSKPAGNVALAQLAGITLTYGTSIKGNSTLSEIWNEPNDLAGSDWDHITLQLYNKGTTTLANDLTWFGNYRNLALQNPNNSTSQFYVHAPWPTQADWSKWNDPVVDVPSQHTKHSLAYSELLVNKLNEQTSGAYRLIPAGEVLAEIRDQIAGVGIPGLSSISDLYRDPIHLNELGRFVTASTFFATMFKQDPSLLAIPHSVAGWDATAVPDVLGHQLQEIVWDVVTSQVLSGVIPPGDFNKDTLVDLADYQIWRDDFGSNALLSADANADGIVNAADYTVWRDNYDAAPAFSSTSAVPEPSALLLLVSGLLAANARRRRRG